MKALLLILLLLTACSKDEPTTYTFREGENNATPLRPTLPHFSNTLSYSFRLGDEWLGMLTQSKAHGLKLPAISGTLNYHHEGANFGVLWYADRGLMIHARYYRDDTLYVLPEIPIQTGVWYNCRIETEPLKWWLNGVLLAQVDTVSVGHFWQTPIYLGKKDVYTALSELKIEIQ
jgi:hypothetical protein